MAASWQQRTFKARETIVGAGDQHTEDCLMKYRVEFYSGKCDRSPLQALRSSGSSDPMSRMDEVFRSHRMDG